ncbi:MAG: MGMT family protein [Bacteroidaceae bacterium]|nr:MGMT family protein [Bacteroidaceae bacterium]
MSPAIGGNESCNRTTQVLPCHRIVESCGSLTGYIGDLTAKR